MNFVTVVHLGYPIPAITTRSGPYLFYSYNYPTYVIGVSEDAEAYIMEDSTLSRFFLVSPGIKGIDGTVSFESETRPGYFLRHANSVLWLDAYETADLYLEDASFYPRPDLFYDVGIIRCILLLILHPVTPDREGICYFPD